MVSDEPRNGDPALTIRLLGPPTVTVDGNPLEVDTRKAVALLAHLAVDEPMMSRQVALGFLWPELKESSARAALRRTLSVLRRGVGEAIVADRDVIRLDASVGVSVDVARFGELFESTAAHGHGQSEACHRCVGILEEAVGLFRGDFMEGFSLRACPPFEMWQLHWAERFRLQLDEALEKLAQACAIDDDFWRAIAHTRRRLAANPLNEQAWCQLMRLHAWNGNRAAALDVYRDCVAALDGELGVPPLETTTELMEAIADNDLQPTPRSRLRMPTLPVDRTIAAFGQLLEAASVLDESFTVDLLRSVSGRSEPETLSAIDELVSRGDFIEERSGTFSFSNPEARERAYKEMTLLRRRLLHGRAADALLARTDPLEATAAASQLERAGRLQEAAQMRVTVAEAATARLDFEMALANYDSAMSLGYQAPERIHEAAGDIHRSAGRYGEALTAYERSAARKPSSRVDAKIGALFARIGRWELAIHHMNAALEDPDLSGRPLVLVDLGMIEVRRGRLAEAEALAIEARRAGADDLSVLAHTEHLLGVLAMRRDRQSNALRYLEQASQLAERVGDDALLAAVANDQGLALAACGQMEAAIAAGRRSVASCIAVGDRHAEAAARNNLADHFRRVGQDEEAIEEVTRGVAIMAEIGIEDDTLEPQIWRLTEW